MLCEKCKVKLTTVDTYSNNENTYRRKKCMVCGEIRYTKEILINNEEGRKYLRRKVIENKLKNP